MKPQQLAFVSLQIVLISLCWEYSQSSPLAVLNIQLTVVDHRWLLCTGTFT